MPHDRELATRFRQALLAVLEGDTDRAETLIIAAVRTDSEDVEPYRALARLYRQRGEVGRAIRIHQNLLLRRDLAPDQRNAALAELAQTSGRAASSSGRSPPTRRCWPTSRATSQALRRWPTCSGTRATTRARWRRRAGSRGWSARRDPAREARLWLPWQRRSTPRGDTTRRARRSSVPCAGTARSPGADRCCGRLEAERGRKKAALAAWRGRVRTVGARAADVYPRIEASFGALGRAAGFRDASCASCSRSVPRTRTRGIALARALAAQREVDAARRRAGAACSDAEPGRPRGCASRCGRLLLGRPRRRRPEGVSPSCSRCSIAAARPPPSRRRSRS